MFKTDPKNSKKRNSNHPNTVFPRDKTSQPSSFDISAWSTMELAHNLAENSTALSLYYMSELRTTSSSENQINQIGVKPKGLHNPPISSFITFVCSMIILSWNISGLGAKIRRNSLRRLIHHHNLDMVFAQVTNLDHINPKSISSLWKDENFEWFSCPSHGNSGGLVSIWKKSFFCIRISQLWQKLDCLIRFYFLWISFAASRTFTTLVVLTLHPLYRMTSLDFTDLCMCNV